MVTDTDPNDIKDSLDRLVYEYEDRISELETANADLESRVDELEDEINSKAISDLEEYASKMLQAFTGHEPNLGEVISLKEDLEKLLTTKYNISLGNI